MATQLDGAGLTARYRRTVVVDHHHLDPGLGVPDGDSHGGDRVTTAIVHFSDRAELTGSVGDDDLAPAGKAAQCSPQIRRLCPIGTEPHLAHRCQPRVIGPTDRPEGPHQLRRTVEEGEPLLLDRGEDRGDRLETRAEQADVGAGGQSTENRLDDTHEGQLLEAGHDGPLGDDDRPTSFRRTLREHAVRCRHALGHSGRARGVGDPRRVELTRPRGRRFRTGCDGDPRRPAVDLLTEVAPGPGLVGIADRHGIGDVVGLVVDPHPGPCADFVELGEELLDLGVQ